MGKHEEIQISHGVALANLLNNLSFYKLTGNFERELVITLCVTVVSHRPGPSRIYAFLTLQRYLNRF